MKATNVLILSLVLLMSIGLVSCNKDSEVTHIEAFDASIDGIAVDPLPDMDIALASRIVKDGDYLPTADATTEEELAPPAPAPTPTPTDTSSSPGPTGPGPGPDGFDPNAF